MEGGDVYQLLTNQLSAVNWFFSGINSVRNQYVGVAYRQELVNGWYGRGKFSCSNRQSLSDVSMGPILDFFSGKRYDCKFI
ncbi:MAG: hypothetical protein IPG07_02220 [Crocinitomicaceae bacterium]|nr:hypothetical protein [Crocinitomicaceae bacterium]